MPVDPRSSKTARLAAYAIIGAVIGAFSVWFVADGFSLNALGSGIAGGAVAGVIAGFVRMRAGLDKQS